MKSKFHPRKNGVDLLCFLTNQEHLSLPCAPGKALGGARPGALAGHRSQGSILGQEGAAWLGFQTFSFPPGPAPCRPCLPTRDLGWKHLLGSELRAWIYGPFQNQTKSLQRGGLIKPASLINQLAAVRFIQKISLSPLSPSLPVPQAKHPRSPDQGQQGFRSSRDSGAAGIQG